MIGRNYIDWRLQIRERQFRAYSQYYRGTNDQLYWSDTHQLSVYVRDYHITLNQELGFKDDASLMISEVYVPRADADHQ